MSYPVATVENQISECCRIVSISGLNSDSIFHKIVFWSTVGATDTHLRLKIRKTEMRSLVVLFVVFIAMVALFGETDGAPSHHKKHSKCTEKLYTALRSLCSYRGESEFLHTSASKCCQSNCELSEMMTMCVVAPNFEDDIIS